MIRKIDVKSIKSNLRWWDNKKFSHGWTGYYQYNETQRKVGI